MNRLYVAIYYIMGLVFFSITLGFALSEFESIILFYSIMISISAAYCVIILGLVTYTQKTSLLELKVTDSLTGTFLGLALLLFANFLFSYGYTLLYQSIYGVPPLVLFGLGLVPLQISTFMIISNIMLHMLIIAPTEEIVFREVLPQGMFHVFKNLVPKNWAIGFSYSVASISYFGIAHLASTHFNPVLMGFIILSSVILAIIRVKYGLLSCVTSHIGNNLASVVF